MPWKETNRMSQKAEMIERAKEPGANRSALSREYGISRKTLYKWLKREQAAGEAGIVDQSRRPQHSPERTAAGMEAQVLAARRENPKWGGRKLRRVLQDQAVAGVPAASTITEILRRHQQIDEAEARKHTPYQRFERDQPNELWQMDFKGYFMLLDGSYCHPLTVIDDHSRFLVGLKACADETQASIRSQLTAIFEQFGLPDSMLMDNGSSWRDEPKYYTTTFSVWLMRLEIKVLHGRPRHPQTQGKDERLNRSLLDEVITRYAMTTLDDSQLRFDAWQQLYNQVRPHDALQLDTPSAHYQPSARRLPAFLPPITYPPGELIRTVDKNGKIYFANRAFRIGKAFRHEPVAVRPTVTDGVFEVFFCKVKVSEINLRTANC
jgi:transposase InsO family protein